MRCLHGAGTHTPTSRRPSQLRPLRRRGARGRSRRGVPERQRRHRWRLRAGIPGGLHHHAGQRPHCGHRGVPGAAGEEVRFGAQVLRMQQGESARQRGGAWSWRCIPMRSPAPPPVTRPRAFQRLQPHASSQLLLKCPGPPTQPNPTQPNQTKPNQTKPNQTNQATHTHAAGVCSATTSPSSSPAMPPSTSCWEGRSTQATCR
jgi:hypothetical protein